MPRSLFTSIGDVMSEIMLLPTLVDLSTLKVASCDLSQEYWTPTEAGEKRRMVFAGIQTREVPDQKTNQPVSLPCAVFLLPGGTDDDHKTVVNGSKRLVAVFENGNVKEGTAVQITYRGKKKNKSNQNMSDDWSVVTLAEGKK
jgi:hypothetical protein